MREMKWQINVNRRRPFITGLHGRGRVYGSARTSGYTRIPRHAHLHTCIRVRVRTGARALARAAAVYEPWGRAHDDL